MKIAKIFSVACLISLLSLSLALADEPTIGWLFNDKIDKQLPVKVYIKDIIDESGQLKLASEPFKKELENSLHERRSIKFLVVNNAAESDIQIAAVIKNFKYMEKGVFKPSPGVGTMLLDAAATMSQNYVEMSVEFTVIDSKTGQTLWKNTISQYLKKIMTEAESKPLIYDAVTRTFVWKCFGKASLRTRSPNDTR